MTHRFLCSIAKRAATTAEAHCSAALAVFGARDEFEEGGTHQEGDQGVGGLCRVLEKGADVLETLIAFVPVDLRFLDREASVEVEYQGVSELEEE
ncbi:hypothetical protein HDU93_004477, partial [Gonapodya sp. JEL0774]